MRVKKKEPRVELPQGLLREGTLHISIVFIRQGFSGGISEGQYSVWEQALPWGEGISPRAEQGCVAAGADDAPAISAVAAFPRSTSQLSTLKLIREPYAPFSHIIKASCLKPGDKREH